MEKLQRNQHGPWAEEEAGTTQVSSGLLLNQLKQEEVEMSLIIQLEEKVRLNRESLLRQPQPGVSLNDCSWQPGRAPLLLECRTPMCGTRWSCAMFGALISHITSPHPEL